MAVLKNQQPAAAQAETAEGRYEQLTATRSPALQRARDGAALTIPALMPPEGTSDATSLPQPFQSVGSRGVGNLAAKLLLALFPPGSSFFRLTVDTFLMDKMIEKAKAQGEDDPTGEVEAALSKVEKAVLVRMEQRNTRPVLSEMFKHLIVCGNALLHIMPNGSLKLFTLQSYVVKRNSEGEAIEIIVKESLNRATLPQQVRDIVAAKQTSNDQKANDTETIALYTRIRQQDNGSWRVNQEVFGTVVPGTQGTYPKDKAAWLALRWSYVPGSDYGRGHVEEFLGDHFSLESLSQRIVEFAGNAARVLWFVNEAGTTSKKKVAEAPNSEVVDGDAKDVTILAMDKFPDFQVVKGTADEIAHRLEQSYLQNSSVQRNAERVTAEEIRFLAGELEQALGGTYSILGQELQRPYVVRLMSIMQRARELPHLPENIVAPQIITGLDGLGRSSDMMKLDMLITGIAQTVGPQGVAEYVNVGAYMKRRAAALGIDIDGIVRSEQEVQASRQQQMQAAMMQKLGPAGIKAMSDQATAAQQQAPAAQDGAAPAA